MFCDIPNSLSKVNYTVKLLTQQMNNKDSYSCEMCDKTFSSDRAIEHYVTSCDALVTIRDTFWQFLNNNFNLHFCCFLNGLSDSDLIKSFLGAFENIIIEHYLSTEQYYIFLYRCCILLTSLRFSLSKYF